jgi:hypothetical protein
MYIGLVLAAALAQASTPAKVCLDDGSQIYMSCMTDKVTVATKYGELAIPITDIRYIDFCFRAPDDAGAMIDTNIKLLGSESYKQRTAALNDLQRFGRLAYPSLKRVNSPDLEILKRVKILLAEMEKTSNLPDTRDHDIIITNGFQVNGKITTKSFKMTSPVLGEHALQLHSLRYLNFFNNATEVELSVDATRTHADWFDTNLVVDKTNQLSITASGQIDCWPQTPGQYMAGPGGHNIPGKDGRYLTGALIGRIGEHNESFMVGEQFEAPVNNEGKLFLRIVSSSWGTASVGTYKVKVKVGYKR